MFWIFVCIFKWTVFSAGILVCTFSVSQNYYKREKSFIKLVRFLHTSLQRVVYDLLLLGYVDVSETKAYVLRGCESTLKLMCYVDVIETKAYVLRGCESTLKLMCYVDVRETKAYVLR